MPDGCVGDKGRAETVAGRLDGAATDRLKVYSRDVASVWLQRWRWASPLRRRRCSRKRYSRSCRGGRPAEVAQHPPDRRRLRGVAPHRLQVVGAWRAVVPAYHPVA